MIKATRMAGQARHAARDISYAHAAATRSGRAVIRVLENATGRIGLIRRAEGYQQDIAAGADFWNTMVVRYGLSLKIDGGSLDNIPREGPLVVVANHPFGILDGLMLGHILRQTRQDFRILAHRVFRGAEELDQSILPISFDDTRAALAANLETRKAAMSYLAAGGAIGVFPGGTVSTSAHPFSEPLDPGWRSFTAKMIARSGATVVPIYFEGENSRVFQLASRLHPTLRVALLIGEFGRRVDRPVRVVVGSPVDRDEIDARRGDANAMMDFLRASTYALSRRPQAKLGYGFEFEAKHRRDARHGGGHI